MSLDSDRTGVAFYSGDNVDKIIGIASGTISSPAPTALAGFNTTTGLYTTNFGDTCYYRGIYSLNNGSTWNDFDVEVPNLTTPSMPVFDTVTTTCAVSSDGTLNVIVTNNYDIVHATSSAYTVLWKIALIAKNTQGFITPLPINDEVFFDSRDFNYQKIAFQGQIPITLTSGSGFTAVGTHNLGYVPKVRAFFQHFTPTNKMTTLYNWTGIETHVTSTQLIFYLDPAISVLNATGQIEWRVYYDQ